MKVVEHAEDSAPGSKAWATCEGVLFSPRDLDLTSSLDTETLLNPWLACVLALLLLKLLLAERCPPETFLKPARTCLDFAKPLWTLLLLLLRLILDDIAEVLLELKTILLVLSLSLSSCRVSRRVCRKTFEHTLLVDTSHNFAFRIDLSFQNNPSRWDNVRIRYAVYRPLKFITAVSRVRSERPVQTIVQKGPLCATFANIVKKRKRE